MNQFYKKTDIENILANYDIQKDFYVPNSLFKNMIYRSLRLEVKWAYIALLHLCLSNPNYDSQDQALMTYSKNQMAKPMEKLMNKVIDDSKVIKYLDELEECGLLIECNGQKYLKKIV